MLAKCDLNNKNFIDTIKLIKSNKIFLVLLKLIERYFQ